MTSNRLCLGTVQFGLPYGINNESGLPSNNEIKKIFEIAFAEGIQVLDTAPAYGTAEEKIGELGKNNFKIVSKFFNVTKQSELNALLSRSMAHLKTNCLYGYLAHNADILIANPGLWTRLLKAKENNQIEKLGYSLYSCQQLEKLLSLNLIPDLVQLPYSLLDRKFEPYLLELKELGAEIHVRSAFLQGLYFMDPRSLPDKLKSLRSNLEELHQCCNTFNISIGSLALNFVLANQYIDKVVIGVDSSLQLQQNIETVKTWKHQHDLINCINNIEVTNKELVNPANW